MDIGSPNKPSSSNEIFQSAAEEESHVSALTQSNESKSELRETDPWNKESQPGSGFGSQKTQKLLECSKLKNSMLSLVSFCNLTTLEVSRCHDLENLLIPSIASSMVQLKRMTITDCKNLEEIIAREGEEVEKKIEYKQLRSLRLQELPSLKSFCSSSYSFSFPSLNELIVKECPKLKIFSHGETQTTNLQKVTGEDKGYWRSDLNTTIKMIYAGRREALEEFGDLLWSLDDLWDPLSGEVLLESSSI